MKNLIIYIFIFLYSNFGLLLCKENNCSNYSIYLPKLKLHLTDSPLVNKIHLKFNLQYLSSLNFNIFLNKNKLPNINNSDTLKFNNYYKKSSIGLQTGFLFSTYFQDDKISFCLTTGLLYVVRKNTIQIDESGIRKNLSTPNSFFYITFYNIQKYNYEYSNIEVPFLLGVTVKNKFNFWIGIQQALFTHKVSEYTYYKYYPIHNVITTNGLIRFDEKIWFFDYYPSMYFYYILHYKKLNLTPFLGADMGSIKYNINKKVIYSNQNNNFFYLKFGILIDMFNNK